MSVRIRAWEWSWTVLTCIEVLSVVLSCIYVRNIGKLYPKSIINRCRLAKKIIRALLW